MTDRSSAVRGSIRSAVLGALLVTTVACSSSSGPGGTGGQVGSGGVAGMNTAGSAGGPANGGSAGALGGAAGSGNGGQRAGGAGGEAGVAGSAGGASGGAAGSAGLGGAGGGPTMAADNLIVNGDAEAAVGSADGLPVATPGWTADHNATAMQYGMAGYPSASDPGPADRGANLFIGGYMDAVSTLTQTIDVSSYAALLDTGVAKATLGGYFGGYADQGDNAVLTATFLDGARNALGTSFSVGGVTAADRDNVTGLLARVQQTEVPSGTRQVRLVLTMTRTDGNANDGYADSLWLTLGATS